MCYKIDNIERHILEISYLGSKDPIHEIFEKQDRRYSDPKARNS